MQQHPLNVPEWVAQLFAQRVTVTSPTGAQWTGRLVGYAAMPTVLIRQDDGHTIALPASHDVISADPVTTHERTGDHASTRTA
jgi:hypothetical protein